MSAVNTQFTNPHSFGNTSSLPTVVQPQINYLVIPSTSLNPTGFSPHAVIQSGTTTQASGIHVSRKIKRQERPKHDRQITDSLLQQRTDLWHPTNDEIKPKRLLKNLFSFLAADEACLKQILALFPENGTAPSLYTLTNFKGVLANYRTRIQKRQKEANYEDLFYFYHLQQALILKKEVASTRITQSITEVSQLIFHIQNDLIAQIVERRSLVDICQIVRYASLLDLPNTEAANQFRSQIYPFIYCEVRPALNVKYSNCWHSVQQMTREFITILEDLQRNRTQSTYFLGLSEHLSKTYKPSDEYIFAQVKSLLERLDLILENLAKGKEHYLPKYFQGAGALSQGTNSLTIPATYFKESDDKILDVSTVCEHSFCPTVLALPAFIEWILAKKVSSYRNAGAMGAPSIYPDEKWIRFREGVAIAQYNLNNEIEKYNVFAVAVRDSEAVTQQLQIFQENQIDIPIMEVTELSILVYLNRMYPLHMPCDYGEQGKFAKKARITPPPPPVPFQLHPQLQQQVSPPLHTQAQPLLPQPQPQPTQQHYTIGQLTPLHIQAQKLSYICVQSSLTDQQRDELLRLASSSIFNPQQKQKIIEIARDPDRTLTLEKKALLFLIIAQLTVKPYSNHNASPKAPPVDQLSYIYLQSTLTPAHQNQLTQLASRQIFTQLEKKILENIANDRDPNLTNQKKSLLSLIAERLTFANQQPPNQTSAQLSQQLYVISLQSTLTDKQRLELAQLTWNPIFTPRQQQEIQNIINDPDATLTPHKQILLELISEILMYLQPSSQTSVHPGTTAAIPLPLVASATLGGTQFLPGTIPSANISSSPQQQTQFHTLSHAHVLALQELVTLSLQLTLTNQHRQTLAKLASLPFFTDQQKRLLTEIATDPDPTVTPEKKTQLSLIIIQLTAMSQTLLPPQQQLDFIRIQSTLTPELIGQLAKLALSPIFTLRQQQALKDIAMDTDLTLTAEKKAILVLITEQLNLVNQQPPTTAATFLTMEANALVQQLNSIASQSILTNEHRNQLAQLALKPVFTPRQQQELAHIARAPDPHLTFYKKVIISIIADQPILANQPQSIQTAVQPTITTAMSLGTITPVASGAQPLPGATSSAHVPPNLISPTSPQSSSAAVQQPAKNSQLSTKPVVNLSRSDIERKGGLEKLIEHLKIYKPENPYHLFTKNLALDPGFIVIEELNKSFKQNLSIGALLALTSLGKVKALNVSIDVDLTVGIYKTLTSNLLARVSMDREAELKRELSKIHGERIELLKQTAEHFPELASQLQDLPTLRPIWGYDQKNCKDLPQLSQTGYQLQLMFNSKLVQSLLFEMTDSTLKKCVLPSSLWIAEGLKREHFKALKVLFRLIAFNLVHSSDLEAASSKNPLVEGCLQLSYKDKKVMLCHNSFDLCDPDGYNLRLAPNEPVLAKLMYRSLSVSERVACSAMLTKEEIIPNNILGNKKAQERVKLFIRHLDTIGKGIQQRYFYKKELYFFKNFPNDALLDLLKGRNKEDIIKDHSKHLEI